MAKKIGPVVLRVGRVYSETRFFVKLGADDTSLPLRTKSLDANIATSGGQAVKVLADPYNAPISFETSEAAVAKANEINRMNGK